MRIRVSAPTRLHFGLLHVPASGEAPAFGGLGAMLDAPQVEVEAAESDNWQYEGSLSARAKSYVERIAPKLRFRRKLFVRADGPPEHVGLGIGTALGLSMATVLVHLAGLPKLEQDEITTLAGRGERSQIGVRGFASGGFLLDDGPSSCRLDFPDDWRFALLTASNATPWHGDRERAAFARPRTRDHVEAATKKLRDTVDRDLVPALTARDFPRFAAALASYNRTAGEPFAEDQGGPYSNPDTAELIAELHAASFRGAGQSSWGPTIYVPLPDEPSVNRLKTHFKGVQVTHIASRGAEIRSIGDDPLRTIR